MTNLSNFLVLSDHSAEDFRLILLNYFCHIKQSNYFELFMCCVVVTCGSLNLDNGDVTYSQTSVDGGYPLDTRASF